MHARLPDVMYGWRVTCVQKRLEQIGKATGPLKVSDLTALGHLDQYHYYETQACDDAIMRMNIRQKDHVLDIGSGIGGPARYMAEKTGARFTCVEMQHELNVMAGILTKRVGLDKLINYKTGDFIKLDLPERHFDAFISFLVFLHIPGKQHIFDQCHKILKPGGRFLIEDMVQIGDFLPDEQVKLHNVISARDIITQSEYLQLLNRAGFQDLKVEELTTSWISWCNQRYQQFISDKNNPQLFGEQIFESRKQFYCTVKDLFNGGNLGGIRVTGVKSE